MNVNKLKVLILIKKYKKVTEVAKSLDVSQPTVTFHMKSLEQEVNLPLFQSRSGSIFLTEAGEALCHYAEKIISLLEESQRINRDYLELKSGTLSIGTSYVPAAYVLPKIITDIKNHYPNTRFSISVKPAPIILRLIATYQLDLGLVSSISEKLPEIHYEAIQDDRLVIVFHPAHPLAKVDHIKIDDLKKIDFISHGKDSTTFKMVDKWRQLQGICWQSSIQVDSLEIIKRILLSGWGVSILSALAVNKEAKEGVLITREIPDLSAKRHIYLAYHNERLQTPLMKEFINRIQEHKLV